MLKLIDIHKTFNPGTINEKVALNGVDLHLNEGDFVTVIGGNGAGKSTMLNAVAGAWPVDSGKIIIGGTDVTKLSEYKRAAYGERCVEYFSGKKGLIPYRVLYIAVAAIAPVISLNLVWTVADILNALMAIPNLIAVLLLSNVIVKETKKYINNLDARDDTPVEVIDK